MDKPREARLSDLALETQIRAMRSEENGLPADAACQQAADMIALETLPAVVCGEVVPSKADNETGKYAGYRETLTAGASKVNVEASAQRGELLTQSRTLAGTAMALDAAEAAGASNSLERMMAHQLARLHEVGMRMLDKGMETEQVDSVISTRYINVGLRAFDGYQQGMLTLQRVKNGGRQTVVVERVYVAPGAQAVLGNVNTGGGEHKPARVRGKK